eukprot:7199941-Pyramimonas_sp.AAC.1
MYYAEPLEGGPAVRSPRDQREGRRGALALPCPQSSVLFTLALKRDHNFTVYLGAEDTRKEGGGAVPGAIPGGHLRHASATNRAYQVRYSTGVTFSTASGFA